MNIREAIVNASVVNGNAFITQPLSAATRNALRTLAKACGVRDATLPHVEDSDLLALYSVARKRWDAGPEIAAKIERKYGAGNPLLDPASFNPISPRTAPPAPAGDFATRDALDAFKQSVWTDLEAISRELRADSASARADLLASVAEAVHDAIAAMAPVQLTVTRSGFDPAPLGLVHSGLERLIKRLGAGRNVYLHGPAGSGKTTAGQQAATALGVPFYTSAKVESEYLLVGFKGPTGETVRTAFREAYEHGGVFLFDEMDASASSAVVAMNMALANGVCAFPDMLVKRHPEFYCIGAGNTKLTGANRQYNGRNALDAASVNRFVFQAWDYDKALELAIAPVRSWALHVQAVRQYVADRALDLLVTPRATIDGCALLAIGETWEEVEEACIFKGLDADTVDAIRYACPAPAGGVIPFGNAA